MTRIADELRSLRDIVIGPDSGMVLAQDTADVTLTSFVDGPGGFEAILGDLKRLKSLRLRKPDDPATPILAMLGPTRSDSGVTGVIVEPKAIGIRDKEKDQTSPELSTAAQGQETLTALRKALDSKMSTNTYKVEPSSDPELISDKKGRYYVIELKSAKTGDRFTFDSGKYTFQTSRAAYKASFNAFAADVLKQLEGRTVFDLLVRGSADAQSYQGPLEPGFEYRKVSYLPSTGRGKYLANLATVPVAGIVKNADLPNLRGEYLRGFLGELYPLHPATLLEGQVVKKDNPAARNTELILYVAW
jgi:hypothetical protein